MGYVRKLVRLCAPCPHLDLPIKPQQIFMLHLDISIPGEIVLMGIEQGTTLHPATSLKRTHAWNHITVGCRFGVDMDSSIFVR
jgi:hypothetical protein